MIDHLKTWAKTIRRDTYALYLAYQQPGVPWYAKLFAALVVGYAFSPIDLIPDFIPVLGYLDDLIIIPVGTALAVRMIPGSVMVACRQQAELNFQGQKSVNWVVGGAFCWCGLS